MTSRRLGGARREERRRTEASVLTERASFLLYWRVKATQATTIRIKLQKRNMEGHGGYGARDKLLQLDRVNDCGAGRWSKV